jgi:raffinose/stachyose/melibiose transport system permease protein
MSSPPQTIEASVPADRRLRTQLPRRRRRRQVPWWWILPGLLVVLALQYAPVIAGSWYALTDFTGIGEPTYIGFENFSRIFDDPVAKDSILHTIELAVVFVVGVNFLGLSFALAINRALKTRHFIRALLFAPVVLTPLATSYIWGFIFQTDGPLNSVLGTIGLDSLQQTWLGDPTWALWCICLVFIWQNTGIAVLIYLAGLQGIPQELDEAAMVDGASTWYRIRRVTLPLLAPAMTVNITLALIQGLRAFDQILALTNGGPLNATETLATQVWKQTFVNGRFGYGAALAVVLTVLVAAAAMLQLALLRANERRL